MKILSGEKISQAIARCNPEKIAVAYLGIDWAEFVKNTSIIKEIILSPTVGTNPFAVKKLAREIGWDKVLFLKELHAKLYIGKDSSILGSANLTKNALSGDRLTELCVEVNNAKKIQELNLFFDEIKSRAEQCYPTKESKMECLAKLEETWGAAISNKIFGDNKLLRDADHDVDFRDFELLSKDHFYVFSVKRVNVKYSKELEEIRTKIRTDIHLLSEDEVSKNKWFLTWQETKSGTPHKTAPLEWIYAHEIYENGVIEEDYEFPKCVVERNDLPTPPPPFRIDKDVSAVFKKIIQEKGVKKFFISDDVKPVKLEKGFEGTPLLISRMREELAKKK